MSRLYFVHIPKTGGITLKAYLENNFARGEGLGINDREASRLTTAHLNRYRLWTGHYSSDVLDALNPRPDLLLSLVRDPVSRLHSWAAHEARSEHREYQTYLGGRSDREALQGADARYLFQSYWLARALRDGRDSTRVPDVLELPALLNQIDLVGLTEHLDRFMQLISFRMGWAPPPLAWHLNRRPDESAAGTTRTAGEAVVDREIRSLMAVDVELYSQASTRFWTAYAAMLNALHSSEVHITPAEAVDIPIETVQTWLRAHHVRSATAIAVPVADIDRRGDDPVLGEGWWWRECPGAAAYRWLGPGRRATLSLPLLVSSAEYDLTLDVVGAADWQMWDDLHIIVNDHAVRAVRERFGPARPGDVTLRVHARLTAEVVARQRGRTEIVLEVPETRRIPGRHLLLSSMDTAREDTRRVGVALHRVRIAPARTRALTALTLRRWPDRAA